MANQTYATDTALVEPAPTRTRRGRARRWTVAALGVGAGLVAAGVCALPPPGIPRPVTIAPGAGEAVVVAASRYRASRFHRFWMGNGYRDLWTTPIRASMVDLGGRRDGLTPRRRGGGRQTRSLRLRGADGREYVFRSLDKDQARALPPLLRATVGRIRQDEVSALHPGATLVAAGLEDAAGVPNATPRLGVMPDAPELGEFRADFGALPGTLQVRPGPGFAGALRTEGTDDLWRALRHAPGDRVDARAYLAVRLMDVYLGDWDRHGGQLTWARRERGGVGTWFPIPRDRDYAFADYRGVLPALARKVDPKVVRFDAGYRDLRGLLVKSRTMDERLLCGLPAATWDSTAAAMARSLSDPAIAAAIERMPREYVTRSARLAATLRARRDHLPDAARRFRALLHAPGRCTRGKTTG
ncbi:MAG TPA: hypothetical protein VFJ82_27055 [Longimicrobium sp.]|nr:hypothetical protein [Longimicrobium sp.]